jgi:enolase-phosphatase E1
MTPARLRCAAIVTDIEGTTGSIAFVHEVLFPYARERLAEFVLRRRDDPEVVSVLEATTAVAHEPGAGVARAIEILQQWMHEDRKATPLKTLQGMIWAQGYEGGELHGHVYDDAIAGLRRWHAAGVALYVYSSGSVAAQKLLFGHSPAGDLTPLFRGYFDTTIGTKSDADAYRRIAAAIAVPPAEILFLSDSEPELDAAALAGWQSACLARAADTPPNFTSKHQMFTSFDAIEVGR